MTLQFTMVIVTFQARSNAAPYLESIMVESTQTAIFPLLFKVLLEAGDLELTVFKLSVLGD